MARWLNICSKCGHKVEADLPNGKCPDCSAASWLCYLLDPPVKHEWLPEPSDDAMTSPNSCNKIQARVRRGVGRPHADISAPEVMQLHSDGKTLRTIAAKVGVSHMTVKRILSGQGVLHGV